ncbi:hypothetical protein C8R43DRAFT_169680 [Mycena crocata]|nr:hypothetical protein C8R43DRAFT_169680 [Mycena crocata]
MPSVLASTVGMWLTAVFLQAILHGMGLLQGFLYFVWYPRDSWVVKGTVILLILLESLQMGMAYANAFNWFIDGFGDFVNLGLIHWQDLVQMTALYISIFVAQAHFARTIYHLDKQHILLPLSISVLSLVALGGGLGQIGLSSGLKEYSKLGETSTTSNLQAAFALATDMLITFGLCYRLNKSRTGIQSTNRVLNFLIMTAINRGVCTMMFAALNVILFVSKPGTFYFMIALMLSDKFYMNSLLAVLNTREHAANVRMQGNTALEELSMPAFAANKALQTGNISVSTVTHETRQGDYIGDGKVPSAF